MFAPEGFEEVTVEVFHKALNSNNDWKGEEGEGVHSAYFTINGDRFAYRETSSYSDKIFYALKIAAKKNKNRK